MHKSLQTCSQFCAAGDAIVLLEDGVYALSHVAIGTLLQSGVRLFALEADVLARGLKNTNIWRTEASQVQMIDYDQFVALCVEFPTQKNW